MTHHVDLETMNRVRLELRTQLAQSNADPAAVLVALLTIASTYAKKLDMDPCELCARVVQGFADVYDIDFVELLRQTLRCAEAS